MSLVGRKQPVKFLPVVAGRFVESGSNICRVQLFPIARLVSTFARCWTVGWQSLSGKSQLGGIQRRHQREHASQHRCWQYPQAEKGVAESESSRKH